MDYSKKACPYVRLFSMSLVAHYLGYLAEGMCNDGNHNNPDAVDKELDSEGGPRDEFFDFFGLGGAGCYRYDVCLPVRRSKRG